MLNTIKTWLNSLTVLVLVGGHGQRLLPWVHLLYPFIQYVIVIDAEHELEQARRPKGKMLVQLFTLGGGHTAQSLLAGSSPTIQAHVQSIGGMVASGGMGQCILVGREAGKRLVDSPDFKRFVKQQLVPELRARSGGSIAEVRFLTLGSIAGGTYSGAELPVAEGAAAMVRSQTGAIVSVEYLATGGLTYEGLGDRTWQNTASALADLVVNVTDPARDPLLVRRLRLIDLPVCGRDQERRDVYLAAIEQVARTKAIAYELEREAPNNALDGRFGNIQIWEAAFGQELRLREDIAPVVASDFLPPLATVLEREPAVRDDERLELADARTPLAIRTVEDVIAGAAERPVENSLAELQTASHRHDVIAWIHLDPLRRQRIVDLPQAWAEPAKTVDALDERLQFVRRLAKLLAEEAATLAARREEVEPTLVDAVVSYRMSHERLNPQGALAYLAAAFTSTGSKLNHLYRAAETIRLSVDELAQLTAEQAAVTRSAVIVQAELDYVERRLRKLIATIQEAGPELGAARPKVTVQPLNERLLDLWEACDLAGESFADAVRESVASATLDGLAAVTGASAARVEEIAQRIVSGDCYATPAVPWGGQRRASDGRTIHLLPPVDHWLRESLVAAVAAKEGRLDLAFVDATVVINVVAVTMRKVRDIDDLFTAPLRSALDDVQQSPCPEMFLPEGLDTLRKLGFVMNDSSANHSI